MNERIRELIKEADWRCSETRGIYDEILAELIVRECMSNLYLNGYDDAMIQIQKHFGVE